MMTDGSDHMATRNIRPTRFDEDAFDLEKAKKSLNNVAKHKTRNKRLRFLLSLGKFVIMLLGFGLFLVLFYLAMEIIALF